MVDGLDLALRVPRRKHRARPIDQIVKILLRVLECRAIGVLALAPNEQIGVESSLQRENPNRELFFDQQA